MNQSWCGRMNRTRKMRMRAISRAQNARVCKIVQQRAAYCRICLMVMSRVVSTAFITSLMVSSVAGQAPPGEPVGRTFAVISIRPQAPSEPAPQANSATPNGYHLSGLGVIVLILGAYTPGTGSDSVLGVNDIVGVPAWAWKEDYGIDARISDEDRSEWNDTRKQPEMLRQMLMNLLTERFHFAAHRETREDSILSLQVAKGGPKFKVTKPDEAHLGAIALPGGGFGRIDYTNRYGTRYYFDVNMTNFAALLSNIAQHPVRDDTKLQGRYDLSFQNPARLNAPSTNDDALDPQPTIFSVMQELGLKLTSVKGPHEVLVIDRIEHPTAN
jgi:uncharacterized protein (TIGR03435 family)